jgi:hypothetical protein
VPVSGQVPSVGTRTEVAYDPDRPAHAIIPGAAVLAETDRARDGVLFTALIAVLVLLTDAWLLLSRRRAARRPASELTVRRVTMRKGLLARTWLEAEIRNPTGTGAASPGRPASTNQSRLVDANQSRSTSINQNQSANSNQSQSVSANQSRSASASQSRLGGGVWIPVYFEPEVLRLPAPATVTMRGDPRRHRLVVIDLPGGGRLYPSGRVRRTEPPGRRTDSPARPDAYTEARATAANRWRQQLRVDAALAVPAPLIGVLWAYLDDGGITSWLGATALAAATALWWAAVRGSDPA